MARSQETTQALSRTKTLEGGLAPRSLVALARRLRVLGRLLVGEDAFLFFHHPRWRCGAYWLVVLPLFGTLACQRTADLSARIAADSARAETVGALVDDFGTTLPTDGRYRARVVSLNPTATEVIFAIGADSLLVGRSRWDEFPAEALSIPSVGDGIRPNVEAVLQARPTLVILYATAENRAAAEAFERAGIRTIALRVDHIAQFVVLTHALGVALDAAPRAATVVDTVMTTINRVRDVTRSAPRRTAVWPLWQSPVMVVGRGSYLDELMEIAGASNVFHDMEDPSPPVNVEEIAQRNPEVVIASAATQASLRERPQWQAVRAVRSNTFALDVPALTGRPSVVLGMAAVHLARELHPELAVVLPPLPKRALRPVRP